MCVFFLQHVKDFWANIFYALKESMLKSVCVFLFFFCFLVYVNEVRLCVLLPLPLH